MDKKVLRDFPDGSQMMQLEDGRIAFVVDPEHFAFNKWADSPMLAHMIRSHANEARIKTHVKKEFSRIVRQYQGLFFHKTDGNVAMRQIQAEISYFMQRLVHQREVQDFRVDVGSAGAGRLQYKLGPYPELIELTFQVEDSGRAIDRLLEERAPAPKGAGDRTLVENIDPERMKVLAGIKPKKFEDVKEDLIDFMNHTYAPISPMPRFVNPIKKMTAKEIVETQPMCTQPAPGAVAEALKGIEIEMSPMAMLKAQRKKDGLCPECGDIKRESAVGVCRDHGKFMG